jgi:oligopeptide/dipeptide ABC transporter ATP-binding protein
MNPLLAVDDLRVAFGKPPVEVLHGISFSLAAGEAVGLVGESGSGKSVTALAIMGLLGRGGAVTGGAIRLDGQDVTRLPEAELRGLRGPRVAMVFQDPNTALNPSVQAGRQIVHVIRAHRSLGARMAWAEALDALARVGMRDPERAARSYPHELSGGMRQRVLIAMAIACRPQLLVADEPTTALDVTVQAQIVALLRNLAAELQLGLLFITHNLDLMAELCDRAVVLYGGRVMEDGPVADIFLRPRHPYTRLLLESIPRLGAQRRPGRRGERGIPASGCPFRPRCERAMERCSEVPDLRTDEGRRVACWRAEQAA